MRGKAAPGSTVIVKDGNTVIGTITADAQGMWTIAPTSPFAIGTHKLTATQVAADGTRTTSAVTTLTISAAAGVGPIITGPVDGTVTPNTRPKFFGTAAPGSTVTLRTLGGTVVGTATAVASAGDPTVGTWVITSGIDLPVGDTTVIATQLKSGVAMTSNTTTVTIDPNAPAPVVIDTPLDLTVTADGTEDVTGTGEPGGYVKLLTNNPEDAKYPGVTVDSAGNWIFKGVQFDSRVNFVYAEQQVQWSTGMVSKVYGLKSTTQSRGGVQLLSSRTATLLADPTTEAVGSTSQTVRVLRVASSTTAIALPVITSPTEGEVLAGNRPTITGTGEPGATITVLDSSDNVIGVALVGADGTWSLVPATALPAGTTSIRAVETLADGTSVGTSEVRSFVIPTIADSTPIPTDTATPTPSTNSTPAPTTTTPATPVTVPAVSTGSSTGAKASTGSATTAKASTGSTTAAKAKVSTAAKLTKLAHTGADLAPLFLGIALLVGGLGAILVAQRGRSTEGRRTARSAAQGSAGRASGRVSTRSISLHSNASGEDHGRGGVAVLARPVAADAHDPDEVTVTRTDHPPRRWAEPDALRGMPLLGGQTARTGTTGSRRPTDRLRPQRDPAGGRRRKR